VLINNHRSLVRHELPQDNQHFLSFVTGKKKRMEKNGVVCESYSQNLLENLKFSIFLKYSKQPSKALSILIVSLSFQALQEFIKKIRCNQIRAIDLPLRRSARMRLHSKSH